MTAPVPMSMPVALVGARPKRPVGNEDEDVNEYELYGIQRDEFMEFNKRKSVTQVSKGRIESSDDVEDEDTTKFVSHFCFPFDYQFLAK